MTMLSGERSLYWKLTGRENLEYLPLAAQAVAVALPTTWAVEILRYHAIGARTVFDPLVEHLLLAASAAALIPLGLWAFRGADRYVRVHGTVGQH